MILEKKHINNITIITIEGLVKLGGSGEFFAAAAQNIPGNLIVDFTLVNYVDSTGIGELVGSCQGLLKKYPKPVFVNDSERITKLFNISGMSHKFQFFPNLEEALAIFN